MRFIVCYDISDNKKRTKVSKKLKAYGIRTQYSVFEVETQMEVIIKLLEEVESLLDPVDKFFVYPIDRKNVKRIKRLGQSAIPNLINYI